MTRKLEKLVWTIVVEKAIQAVKDGLTLRKAFDTFGIRFNTLFYGLKKKKENKKCT